ncbi:MAG: transposase [bacterium LCO1.1]|uniref:Transposase n=1 Tax=Candidatus Weimeria bifida TaxID=2599074 RepID=A0A6N7IY21_9FIRM|nr:transposase [Candidatus Weimeria bifida]
MRRYDVILDRQDMAGWFISVYRYYLKPVHLTMKKQLMKSKLLHCDETPFVMPKNQSSTCGCFILREKAEVLRYIFMNIWERGMVR